MGHFPFRIYGNHDILENKKPICITLGNFDGVHIGHRYLIEYILQKAENYPLVVVTFLPHSADFFHPDTPKPLLTCWEDKVALLLDCGVQTVVVQPFDQGFAALSADDFCAQWLQQYFSVHHIFLGHDFCYGRHRQGNLSHMQQFALGKGWQVSQIPSLQTQETPPRVISSSFIRSEIAHGRVDVAASLLGRPYAMRGIVFKGDQRGRQLGFPTANIHLHCNYLVPLYGVYACYVQIQSGPLLPAVMNCGVRPSISNSLQVQIEAHIFNFNREIYGENVTFYIKKYLRPEKKFNNLDELKYQIKVDIESAQRYFDQED